MQLSLPLLPVVALAFVFSCSEVSGQCSTAWSAAAVPPGVNGNAWCRWFWDPDGAGPMPLRFLIAGDSLIGSTSLTPQKVLSHDGSQWLPLANGPGTAGTVFCMTTWNGQLVVGGSFTGGGLDHIALYNGSGWQALGTGLANTAVDLTTWNGNLVAVHRSTSVSTASVWNGSAWSDLPSMPPSASAFQATCAVSYQGQIWVRGYVAAFNTGVIHRWNGNAWLTPIAASSRVNCMAVRNWPLTGETHVYAAGSFATIGGQRAEKVARTTGGATPTWAQVGNGTSDQVLCMHVRPTSTTGTTVTIGLGDTAGTVLQTSTSIFTALGNLPGITAISTYGTTYVATDVSIGNTTACSTYANPTWQPLVGDSITGDVRALTPSGADMIVGGAFQVAVNAQANRIARWNGTAFQPLGTGVNGTSVDALLTLGNGDIVAGGQFTTAGGMGAGNIARWDGGAWSALGSGCDQPVLALARMPNGDVVAGGKFTSAGGVACSRIARWNGANWSPLGFGFNGDVLALAVRSDGTLFAGGAFTASGAVGCSHVAQWNGSTWAPLGFGVNGDVRALAVRPNDEVVMTGSFTTVIGLFTERCARWRPDNTWATMGAASGDASAAQALCVLTDGDVVAGRGFHQPGTSPDTGVARWDGLGWSGFGTGLASSPAGASVGVRAIALRADGALIVGGTFGIADGLATNGLAKLTSTCPATASSSGTGCVSSGGSNTLAATSLPWVDTTFHATGTGLPSLAIVVALTSVTSIPQGAAPLASIFAEGVPGCDVLVAPDILETMLTTTGSATSTLFLPSTPPLVGVTFHHQMIPIELGVGGTFAAITATNALALTAGVF